MNTLLNDAGVSGIVENRIYADFADGVTAAPYLVYQVITTGGETCHDRSRDIEFPLIQITGWAASKFESVALGDAVTAALDGVTQEGIFGLTLTFSDRQGQRDHETKLFGEIMEFRGATAIY